MCCRPCTGEISVYRRFRSWTRCFESSNIWTCRSLGKISRKVSSSCTKASQSILPCFPLKCCNFAWKIISSRNISVKYTFPANWRLSKAAKTIYNSANSPKNTSTTYYSSTSQQESLMLPKLSTPSWKTISIENPIAPLSISKMTISGLSNRCGKTFITKCP